MSFLLNKGYRLKKWHHPLLLGFHFWDRRARVLYFNHGIYGNFLGAVLDNLVVGVSFGQLERDVRFVQTFQDQPLRALHGRAEPHQRELLESGQAPHARIQRCSKGAFRATLEGVWVAFQHARTKASGNAFKTMGLGRTWAGYPGHPQTKMMLFMTLPRRIYFWQIHRS